MPRRKRRTLQRRKREKAAAFRIDNSPESVEEVSAAYRIFEPDIEVGTTIPATLPKNTPAWSENGKITVAPTAFLMSSKEQSNMLKHEKTHAFHQLYGGTINKNSSYDDAEKLASKGEKNYQFKPKDFSAKAPPVSAYKMSNLSPWKNVWIGHSAIIGEVKPQNISFRVKIPYSKLGIKTGFAPKQYLCGNKNMALANNYINRSKKVAQVIAKFNRKIPSSGSVYKVNKVLITSALSGYRFYKGKGLMVISNPGDFSSDQQAVDTAAHETSHAIYEYHAKYLQRNKTPNTQPDPLALRFGLLYHRLASTKKVPIPKKKFNQKKPPRIVLKSGEVGVSAGYAMVSDVLWSGSGGHPQTNLSEFFASSFAGYIQNRRLLRKSVNYYGKVDRRIRKNKRELYTLLWYTNRPSRVKRLRIPKGKLKKEAMKKIKGSGHVPDFSNITSGNIGELLTPNTLSSPSNQVFKILIKCIPKKTKSKKSRAKR